MKKKKDKPNPFEIDKNHLDDHLEEQPNLAVKYNEERANLQYDLALAKDRLKVMEVEVANKVRLRPKKYKIKKVTEGAIKEAVLMHKDVQALRRTIIDLEYSLDLTNANCEAVKHRKQSLTDLVMLHGQMYFATVTTRKNKND